MRTLIVIDTETDAIEDTEDGSKWKPSTLHCVGYAYKNDDEEYVTGILHHPEDRDEIQEFLTGSNWLPTFHFAGFDLMVFDHFGYTLPIKFHDTMLAAWCLYPGLYTGHRKVWSLESLTQYFETKHQKYEYEDKTFTSYTDEMGLYCVNDCLATYDLAEVVLSELQDDESAWNIYTQIELPFVIVLLHMEEHGLRFDVSRISELIDVLHDERTSLLEAMEQIIRGCILASKTKLLVNPMIEENLGKFDGGWKFVGKVTDPKDGRIKYKYQQYQRFNPNSSDHKAKALMEVYEHQFTEFTATNKPKVDKGVLEQMVEYPLAQLLVEHSAIAKLLSTYCEPILESNGLLQTRWRQTGTKTGRLSSSPNLQNIPARSEFGKMIRDAVIAKEGYTLVGVDLSQIELRILSWLQIQAFGLDNDKYPDARSYYDAFMANRDPHMERTKITFPDVTDEKELQDMRSLVKVITFGGLYGFGNEKFARIAKIPLKRAEELSKANAERFPSINALKRIVWKEVRRNKGIAHTVLGRRLVYENITSGIHSKRAESERQVFNAIIQGTNADILKIFVLKCFPELLKLNAHLLVLVHDELVIEVPTKWAKKAKTILDTHFNHPPDNEYLPGLPIVGEAKIGSSWKELK